MKTLVIGAAILDLIVQVDRVPASGEDVLGQDLKIMTGGCAYNVAATLRNLSCPHDLCVPVGTGVHGDMIRKELQEKGYKVLIRDEERDNGFCLCMVEKSGERTFVTVQGIEGEFRREWLLSIRMEEYDSVYLAGYQACGTSGRVIADWLSGHEGIRLYFAPGPVICDIDTETMQQLLALHPVLHLNEKELLDFTGEDTVEKGLKKIYTMNRNTVIVTLGSRGALCWDGRQLLETPGVKAKVVDTIGAGDSHIGAVIACLAKGMSLKDSMETANRTAACVTEVQGAVMSKEMFDRKMEEHK